MRRGSAPTLVPSALVVDLSPSQRRVRCGSVTHNPCRCFELPAKLINLVLVAKNIRGKEGKVVKDCSLVNIQGLQPGVCVVERELWPELRDHEGWPLIYTISVREGIGWGYRLLESTGQQNPCTHDWWSAVGFFAREVEDCWREQKCQAFPRGWLLGNLDLMLKVIWHHVVRLLLKRWSLGLLQDFANQCR